MATLADQVREMLRILEVVDPQAAAKIKGQPVSTVTYAVPSTASEPTPATAVEAPVRAQPASAQVRHSAEAGLEHPLLTDVSPEHLVQGIIWSEVLGRPVCRRRSQRG